MARRAESSLLDREHKVVAKSSLCYNAFSDHHSMSNHRQGKHSVAQCYYWAGLDMGFDGTE